MRKWKLVIQFDNDEGFALELKEYIKPTPSVEQVRKVMDNDDIKCTQTLLSDIKKMVEKNLKD